MKSYKYFRFRCTKYLFFKHNILRKNLKVNYANYIKNFGGNSIDDYLVKYFSI